MPIPVFYAVDDTQRKTAIYSSDSIKHLIELIATRGPDVWWTMDVEELMPESMKLNDPRLANGFVKGPDIFDVWLDSGLSWNYVIDENDTADLYLEGTDQTHGWFQSSLILSIALRGIAPYKSVYVHGFAVDKDGRKMSKSLGNVVDPENLLNEFGADVLRYYVCKYGSIHYNFPVDKAMLKNCANDVFKVL